MYFPSLSLMMELSRVAWEAQMVIAMRTAGMMGFWHMGPGEEWRMVTEKQRGGWEAATAASRAAMSGGSPDAIARAGLRPIGRKTAANARRLNKLGPKY